MRQPLRLACLVLLLLVTGIAETKASSPNTDNTRNKSSVSQVYSERLAGLDLPLMASVDGQLRRKIGQYVVSGGNGTELMLGRAELYFPIFEFYLRKKGLPSSLKYLPVAESRLRAKAVSPALAAGLWQLMPGTARSMGLVVNSAVDERLNVHRASEAAVDILAELHEQFGDWNLVLAAYNCGAGRVRKAIRQSGSRDYAKVKRYLPKETKQYVAAYLAAAYAVNFYGDHGLTPRSGKLTKSPLGYLRIYQELSLRKVAKEADLDYWYLRALNPSYLRGYIPKNRKGYRLCVPHHAMFAVQQALWSDQNYVLINQPEASPLAYQMAEELGFNPYRLLFGCGQSILLEYNQLNWAAPVANTMVHQVFEQQQALAMHP